MSWKKYKKELEQLGVEVKIKNDFFPTKDGSDIFFHEVLLKYNDQSALGYDPFNINDAIAKAHLRLCLKLKPERRPLRPADLIETNVKAGRMKK